MDLADDYGMGIMPDGDPYQQQIMNLDYEMEEPTLSFWQLDKTDKIVCGVLFVLVLALIVILILAKT